MNIPPVERADWLGMPGGVALIPGGSVTSPEGFRAAGVGCGLKPDGQLDLGVLVSDRPANSSLVDTANALPAAAILRNRSYPRRGFRAVVVNSANANAGTGDGGLADAFEMGERTAHVLGLAPEEVATSSTGVIARRLAMDLLRVGIDAAGSAATGDGGADFARAICTTDIAPKTGAFSIDGARVGVAAKGAGMISPQMATMLCYVTTDAAIRAEDLQALTETAAERSFNRISVDGQMSPSDTLIVIANGGGQELSGGDLAHFGAALTAICRWAALQIVKDGEGTEHVVRLLVDGAASDTEAEHVARAVGNSLLVKTAIFGRDPNWGRIEQAVGHALVGTDGTTALSLRFDGLTADDSGIAAVMALPEYEIAVGLGRGSGTAELFVTDLSHAYVTLNADYTT